MLDIHKLDLVIHGETIGSLRHTISELGVPESAVSIDQADELTGIEVIDLVVKIQEIEFGALEVLLGYLIGKGIKVEYIVNGAKKSLTDLKSLSEMIKEYRKNSGL